MVHRRISGFCVTPPKNNVCENEPTNDFHDVSLVLDFSEPNCDWSKKNDIMEIVCGFVFADVIFRRRKYVCVRRLNSWLLSCITIRRELRYYRIHSNKRRGALQRLQCIFIILWKYSNKRRTAAAALIRGRRLLTFPPYVRRLIEGGA